METVVKGITREALYFDCETTRPRWSKGLYNGGPVRNYATGLNDGDYRIRRRRTKEEKN